LRRAWIPLMVADSCDCGVWCVLGKIVRKWDPLPDALVTGTCHLMPTALANQVPARFTRQMSMAPVFSGCWTRHL